MTVGSGSHGRLPSFAPRTILRVQEDLVPQCYSIEDVFGNEPEEWDTDSTFRDLVEDGRAEFLNNFWVQRGYFEVGKVIPDGPRMLVIDIFPTEIYETAYSYAVAGYNWDVEGNCPDFKGTYLRLRGQIMASEQIRPITDALVALSKLVELSRDQVKAVESAVFEKFNIWLRKDAISTKHIDGIEEFAKAWLDVHPGDERAEKLLTDTTLYVIASKFDYSDFTKNIGIYRRQFHKIEVTV